ncbi:hypothetical protein BC835DRAFT_1267228 [Cytidiella melzeri]|nr:hypothetical protein BC835DRAFT_1267228 [Cytidiella melzeri]
MYTRAVLFATLLSTAFAHSDRSPIIAWSSHSSPYSVSKSTHASGFLESLLTSESICDHDAVILVDQAGLHASDLRSLSHSSTLAQKLANAPWSVELPYMLQSSGNPFTSIGRAVAERCGSKTLTVSSGELGPHVGQGSTEKHVVYLEMPELEGFSKTRHNLLAECDNLLSSDLEAISIAFPKHLVLYAGWTSSLQARQVTEDDSLGDTLTAPLTSAASALKVAPSDGGILKRYQLLSPGLIISLLVAFFVLVPVVFLGISSLASIQSPVRLDAPKGFNAAEKKNQ